MKWGWRSWMTLVAGAATLILPFACGLQVQGTSPAAGPDAGDDATVTGSSCVPTGPEQCNNGVDDDCNGLVDCDDPACADLACVAIPVGWSAVSVAEVGDAGTVGGDGGVASIACGSGFRAPTTYLRNPHPSVEGCACTCAPLDLSQAANNPCLQEKVTVALGNGAVLCDDGSVQTDGACAAIPNNTTRLSPGSAAPLRNEKVGCPAAIATPSPLVHDGSVTLCSAETPGQCARGVCLPRAAATCVMRLGDAECPTGYPTRSLIASSNVTDSRTCGPCICTPDATACDDPHVELFNDNACVVPGNVPRVNAGGACTAVDSQSLSVRYVAKPNKTTCSPQAAVVAGGGNYDVSLTTLCCP